MCTAFNINLVFAMLVMRDFSLILLVDVNLLFLDVSIIKEFVLLAVLPLLLSTAFAQFQDVSNTTKMAAPLAIQD